MVHFFYEKRYTIEVFLKTNKSKIEIAKLLKIDKSVIYPELKRNCDLRSGVYKSKTYTIKNMIQPNKCS